MAAAAAAPRRRHQHHQQRHRQYDKLFLVASGAGLTPMISLINRYADTKEVYLLWMTRDRHMVTHFRGVLERCHSMVCFTEKGADADAHFATLQKALRWAFCS
jgi:ferredoxin-NADP reductase